MNVSHEQENTTNEEQRLKALGKVKESRERTAVVSLLYLKRLTLKVLVCH